MMVQQKLHHTLFSRPCLSTYFIKREKEKVQNKPSILEESSNARHTPLETKTKLQKERFGDQ